jgi:hypothetical protein
MKNIIKNPLFYLSVVLIIAVGFTVFNLVKADTFREPTKPFPQSDVNAPIDESGIQQTKEGDLVIKGGMAIGMEANEIKFPQPGNDIPDGRLELSSGIVPGMIWLPTSVQDRNLRGFWTYSEIANEALELELRGLGNTTYTKSQQLGRDDICFLTGIYVAPGGNGGACRVYQAGSYWHIDVQRGAHCYVDCFDLKINKNF